MDFFDCNLTYGLDHSSNDPPPAGTIAELEKQMANAGVKRGVLWRVEQYTGAPLAANDLLAADLKDRPEFYGILNIVPSDTRETASPEGLPVQMKKQRMIGWRMCPARSRFLPRAFVFRDYFELAVQKKIPVFIHTAYGVTLEHLAEIMEHFPQLTVVLTYFNDWPSERLYYPFLREYPNLHLDLAFSITEEGIESFVNRFGSRRLLYGSGFPFTALGPHMLMVKHASIPDADKEAIAHGNLERLIREVKL